MVSSYRNIDIDTAFEFGDELVRDGSVYTVPLKDPVTVTTGAISIESALLPESKFAILSIDTDLQTFLSGVETRVVNHCLAHKDTWFGGNDAIEEHLRKFVFDGEVKVRVDTEDLTCFDARKGLSEDPPAPGVRINALLEASKITFGRTEFGLIWTLRQVRVLEECKIPDEEAPPLAPVNTILLNQDVEGVDESIDAV